MVTIDLKLILCFDSVCSRCYNQETDNLRRGTPGKTDWHLWWHSPKMSKVLSALGGALPDERPLLSLQIVETVAKCPTGYWPVSRTYDEDADAGLLRQNGLFGKKPSHYICLSKSEGELMIFSFIAVVFVHHLVFSVHCTGYVFNLWILLNYTQKAKLMPSFIHSFLLIIQLRFSLDV